VPSRIGPESMSLITLGYSLDETLVRFVLSRFF
jgi:hypothetical protein